MITDKEREYKDLTLINLYASRCDLIYGNDTIPSVLMQDHIIEPYILNVYDIDNCEYIEIVFRFKIKGGILEIDGEMPQKHIFNNFKKKSYKLTTVGYNRKYSILHFLYHNRKIIISNIRDNAKHMKYIRDGEKDIKYFITEFINDRELFYPDKEILESRMPFFEEYFDFERAYKYIYNVKFKENKEIEESKLKDMKKYISNWHKWKLNDLNIRYL